MGLQYWFNYFLILFLWLGIIYLILKHVFAGKIFVGFGQGLLAGRSWANRKEEPLFYWIIIFLEIFVGVLLYMMVASAPEHVFDLLKNSPPEEVL